MVWMLSSCFSVGVSIVLTYVIWLQSIVFAIVSLPLSDSLYGVQLLTMPLILSCNLVKFWLRCLRRLSMSKPRMVKDDDQVIPRTGHIMSVGLSFIPMGMTWVLSRSPSKIFDVFGGKP